MRLVYRRYPKGIVSHLLCILVGISDLLDGLVGILTLGFYYGSFSEHATILCLRYRNRKRWN